MQHVEEIEILKKYIWTILQVPFTFEEHIYIYQHTHALCIRPSREIKEEGGKEIKCDYKEVSTSAVMQELVRITGEEYCPVVSESVSWCFSTISNRGDIPALLTLQQGTETGENALSPSHCMLTFSITLLPLSFFVCCPVPLAVQSHSQMHCWVKAGIWSDSSEKAEEPCRSNGDSRAEGKRASVAGTVCVRKDCLAHPHQPCTPFLSS